jgi:hypothetical protein
MTDEQLFAELVAIRKELRELSARFGKRNLRRVRIDPALERFMRALVRVAPEGIEFTSAEVIGHARLESERELRESLVAVIGSLSSKRLGKLLKRLEGCPFACGAIARIGETGNVALWAVSKPQESPKPALTVAADSLAR